MTPRQKRIIGVLVVTNAVIILGLVLFITRFWGSASSALLPTAVPTYPPGYLSSQECQQRAAEMMSQAGLSGAAAVVPGGALQLDLAYRDTGAESLGNAAQQVWEAFDVAAALAEDRCAVFSRVEIRIDVRSRSDQKLGRIYAAVPVTHLKAFHNGSLSESEFIDQVTYKAIPAGEQAGEQ